MDKNEILSENKKRSGKDPGGKGSVSGVNMSSKNEVISEEQGEEKQKILGEEKQKILGEEKQKILGEEKQGEQDEDTHEGVEKKWDKEVPLENITYTSFEQSISEEGERTTGEEASLVSEAEELREEEVKDFDFGELRAEVEDSFSSVSAGERPLSGADDNEGIEAGSAEESPAQEEETPVKKKRFSRKKRSAQKKKGRKKKKFSNFRDFLNELKSIEGTQDKIEFLKKKFMDDELRSLPPYDPELDGPLLEYKIPEDFTELERYWVEEPYAFVSIIENREVKYYNLVEPTLTAYEKTVLEKVRDNLEDTLTQEDMGSGVDMSAILINRALRLLEQYYETLDVPSLHKVVYFLRRNFIGYERINGLVLDPDIEDISCSGINIPIYLYHRIHNNIVTNVSFGEKELDSLVVKLCQRSGKHISIGEPIVDATLPDGSRIQATLGKEVTTRGSSFTIRKFKGDPITPIDLIKYQTCNVEMMSYYWLAIENNISVLLAGGTASGKTSLMNAISLFIPVLSKIVSIEDTREIMLHHENWIAGATRRSFTVGGTGEVSMYELLKAALRQRPEYIIVGEVRGKEALTLFQAMSTGHTTYSTMHASDVQTVVNRLENEPINVPHVMMQALGVISIQMQTYVDEVRVRRTKTIVEITGLDARTGSLRINELYKWDPLNDVFKRAGDSYVLNEIMRARGWKQQKLMQEFRNRQQILAYMAGKQIRDYVSISLIVHLYSTNPELVMESIENGTLENLILHRA